jgi:DNA repair protein RadC
MTDRLRAAGELIGVPVIDHVIVAQDGAYSFSHGRLLD